jgi:hypothetical protein
MAIYDTIKTAYPQIEDIDFINGTIMIQDDSDGQGEFLAVWNYSEPLPSTLTVGKNGSGE